MSAHVLSGFGQRVAGLDRRDLGRGVCGETADRIGLDGSDLRVEDPRTLARRTLGAAWLPATADRASEGSAYGVSMMFDRVGRKRAALSHKRLREYPVSGGPSTQRVTTPLGELHAYSRRLLLALGWSGVAMVEWKLHPVDGRPDAAGWNPRFWGSLALAVRAGVDFPKLYADAALDRLPRCTLVRRSRVVALDVARRHPAVCECAGRRARADTEVPSGLSSRRGGIRPRGDIRGTIACGLCQALLAANPKYWRYLRRSQ